MKYSADTQVDKAIENALRLYQKQKYQECYQACEDALRIEPTNPFAIALNEIADNNCEEHFSYEQWDYAPLQSALSKQIRILASRTSTSQRSEYEEGCLLILSWLAIEQKAYLSKMDKSVESSAYELTSWNKRLRSDAASYYENDYELYRIESDHLKEKLDRIQEKRSKSKNDVTAPVAEVAVMHSLFPSKHFLTRLCAYGSERAQAELAKQGERSKRHFQEKVASYWDEHSNQKNRLDRQASELEKQIAEKTPKYSR